MDSTHRKEVFSQRVRAGKRTYFFDVKETVDKRVYIVISESVFNGSGHEHNRVMVFDDNLKSFVEGFESLRGFLKKNQSL